MKRTVDIITLFCMLLFAATFALATPVAKWTFEECNGTTTRDVTGNGNDGVLIGNNIYWAMEGHSGCALQFVRNSYVRTAHMPTIDLTNQVTVEAWIKRDFILPSGESESIVAKNGPYYLGTQSNRARAGVYTTEPTCPSCPAPSWKYVSGSTVLQPGVWYKVAMSFDGSRLKIYVNDQMEGEVNAAGQMGRVSQDIFIGYGEPGLDQYFHGLIDDVSVRNAPSPFTPDVLPFITVIGMPNSGSNVTLNISDPGRPNTLYTLGLATGTTPGIRLSDGRVIPLNPDFLLFVSLVNASSVGLWNSQGTLDSTGATTVIFKIPEGTPSGLTIYAAFIAYNPNIQNRPIIAISSAVTITSQ